MKEIPHSETKVSFWSSIFSTRNPANITLGSDELEISAPKLINGVLRDEKIHFKEKIENIFSISSSYKRSIVLGIIGLITWAVGYVMNADRYIVERDFAFIAMLAFILGGIGYLYIHEILIKPKKTLQEINLSKEFLIKGACVVVIVILF